MTAGAMILGMIPMALGVGEGGEQNAPLARAVIGGLALRHVRDTGLRADHVSAAATFGAGNGHLTGRTSLQQRNQLNERGNDDMSLADVQASSEGDRATAYRSGTGRRLQIFAGLAAIALTVAFFVVHRDKARHENELSATTAERAATAPSVTVIPARAAQSSYALSLPGETAAWYESTIFARVNGYVAKWRVDIGDRVKKGEVMAIIETPELDAELIAGKAKLTAAEAQVKVREAEANFANISFERWRDSPKGVVSDQERDAKKAEYDSAVARLNAARAQVALDQADVDKLTTLAQFKQVQAPFDGTVVERRIDIGNLVTAGSTTNTTPLYRVTQDDPLRIFVDVPQSAAQCDESRSASADKRLQSRRPDCGRKDWAYG